jgi:hypothetical protein
MDTGNRRIRMIDTAGIISTVGGSSTLSSVQLGDPRAIWGDSIGNLYVADSSLIRRITAGTNIVTTVVGGGSGTAENIPGTSYAFTPSFGLWGDSNNNLFIAESSPCKIKRMSISTSKIVTVAGNGNNGFADNL